MQDSGSDRLGRWTWLQLPYQQDKNVRIIQLYHPNPKYGLFNTATQQYQALLREKPDTEPNVRKQLKKTSIPFYIHVKIATLS